MDSITEKNWCRINWEFSKGIINGCDVDSRQKWVVQGRAYKIKISRAKPSAALLEYYRRSGGEAEGGVVADANLTAIPTWRSIMASRQVLQVGGRAQRIALIKPELMSSCVAAGSGSRTGVGREELTSQSWLQLSGPAGVDPPLHYWPACCTRYFRHNTLLWLLTSTAYLDTFSHSDVHWFF